jgi:hypothetical protein
MRIYSYPQRSPEWFAARLGRLTGSRASDMLATIKSGEAAARRDLRVQLVCERLTNQVQESGYINAEMQRGIDLEPVACKAYQELSGNEVTTVGLLQHDELMAACSPDGLVGDKGGLELKCPKAATHLAYLKAGTLPKEHSAQVTHNLWITGRDWWDFVSYDDRWPERFQIFHVRVHRDEKVIADYEKAAKAFLKEVDLEVAGLIGWGAVAEATV